MSWLPKIGICRKVLSIAWLCMFGAVALAQKVSPFDLIPLLDSTAQRQLMAVEASDIEVDQAGKASEGGGGGNPFDLIVEPSDRPSTTDDSLPGSEVESQDLDEVLDIDDVDDTVNGWVRNQTGMALLILGLILLISVALISQGQALQRMVSALVNDNFLSRLLREQHKGSYYLWAAIGAVLIAVFVYFSLPLVPLDWLRSESLLPRYMLAICLITAGKFVALGLLRATFSSIARPLESYQMVILLWTGIMGLLLFPLLVFVAFAAPSIAVPTAIVGMALLVLLYLLRAIRVLGSNLRLLGDYPLHFLLYLCALEITPLLLAFSWLRG